jgi:hypothetical protein
MNYRSIILSLISSVLYVGTAFGQRSVEPFRGKIQPKVCYGTNINADISIPATKEILNRLKSKSAKKTQFLVTYHNFPSNAQSAFQYALDVWSAVLYTSVPVRVDAYWDATLPSGVLGSTNPGNFYRNIEGAYKYDIYYPIVLAEKILGHSLDIQTQTDIEIHLSSSMPWYFGTDAKPGAYQYDLTTVTLHEICHGLGFTGSFYAALTPMGSYGDGANNIPEIFDYYVKNSIGQQFVDTNIFKNPSVKLGRALTYPNQVFFDGIMTRNANSNQKVTLYSPIQWSSGSSIYHVGDIYYLTVNTLMYYAIDLNEAVHDPGSMLTGMMGDLGWVHTWIRHDTLPDIETISGPRIITATIHSDTTITPGSFYLNYSFNNFTSHDSAQMIHTINPNEYYALITIPKLETTVSYYLSVKDIFNRIYSMPGGSPAKHYHFFAGKDTIPPAIQHQPLPFILNTADSMKLSAVVTDNIGVDTVYVEYKHNNSTIITKGMKIDSVSVYACSLDFSAFSLSPGDSISYRIVAIDKSVSKNISYSPVNGYHVLAVVGVPSPATSYYSTFDSLSYDFLFSGFNISRPAGFVSSCLNSNHPYASPDMNNAHFDYFAQLRIPIIVNKYNAFIMFDEVALVEPNDSGYAFGSSNFYDYVIVEGSKDGGNTWNYFIPGWNCTSFPDWQNRFLSNTDNNGNSLALGDMNLYHKRHLDMLSSGSFKGGDTIFIRFRLYSDPYLYGWGWAIDNLNIQNVAMDNPKAIFSGTDIQIFPNPASDLVNFRYNLPYSPAKVQLQFINTLGETVMTRTISNPGNSVNESIQLEGLQRGVYLAVIWIDNTRIVRKLSIIR